MFRLGVNKGRNKTAGSENMFIGLKNVNLVSKIFHYKSSSTYISLRLFLLFHSLVSILVFLFWLDIYKLSQVLLVALLA